VVWLLGFTFASNNSPYFVTSAFLGDYLATLGKPELLGAALDWFAVDDDTYDSRALHGRAN
jgi:hypothetical protein